MMKAWFLYVLLRSPLLKKLGKTLLVLRSFTGTLSKFSHYTPAGATRLRSFTGTLSKFSHYTPAGAPRLRSFTGTLSKFSHYTPVGAPRIGSPFGRAPDLSGERAICLRVLRGDLVGNVCHNGARAVGFYHFQALFNDLKINDTTLVSAVFENAVVKVRCIH